jgi:TatD DNase family protein
MSETATGLQFHDAHCHLYDARLKAALEPDPYQGQAVPIAAQVTNGTHPDNWCLIRNLDAFQGSKVLKAYGVHPWRVDDLPENWESVLRSYLESDAVSVGEIGLDNWIEPRDERLQLDVFMQQLQVASETGLPPSIHCVRAYGKLIDCLRSGPDLPGGFLAHGFGGSKEVLYQLMDMGGYVSFSAYGAHPGRKRIRDAVRACPADRLLAETDAPDMVPPVETCVYPISDTNGRLQHPFEIETAYTYLANWRGEPVEKLAQQIASNFKKLFGQ